MRWLRLYTGVREDPKAQMLAPDLFKHWINLLCIAAEHDGELPSLAVTAFMLGRIAEPKAAGIIAKLHSHGLLDKTEKGFKPHNWEGRQYKHDKTDNTNAERQARYRNGKRNANSNGVTPVSDKRTREQITDTEEEKKEARAGALWPEDYADQFWDRYPNKVGKPAALAKLETIRKRGVPFEAIMAGLERYIAGKPADRAWLNPLTFLNQARWEDQPAAPDQRGAPIATVSEMPIEDAVRMLVKTGRWSNHANSPAPGEPGCKASVELLAKYGLREDGRKISHETSH